MSAKEKSSGWKIPLLFCTVVVAVVGIGSLVLSRFRQEPEFPKDLLVLAKQTTIDLNAPENGNWREAIINAASGFAPYEVKDDKLARVVSEALEAKRPDMAAAAVSQMRDGARKNGVLETIFFHTLKDCADAPRAPGLIRAMTDDVRAGALNDKLTVFWQYCREKSGK